MMNDTHREGPGRLAPMVKGLGLGSALMAGALLLGGSMAAKAGMAHEFDDDDDNGAFCSKTSHAALRACRNEVRDDFWIAIGNCANLSDDDERETCVTDARVARKEARGECADQFEAREEVCDALGQAPYDPQPPASFEDPLSITDTNANPYFPLVPGTKWVYENEVDGETITVVVTHETKEILGVECIVVNDVVSDTDSGEVIEDTDDYYAQDSEGNVWYFGEIAQDFEDGELVGIEGSWKAGRDSAKQGILMKANPQVGDVYRQEFFLGDAEDLAEVLSLSGTESVPGASCDGDCLVTKDFSPIEPGVFENKFYAPGVGTILEVNPQTGARVELVEAVFP